MSAPRPVLTQNERDRRWRRVRAVLGTRALDGLIVGSFRGREAYDSYLTNDHLDGIIVFPAAGEPTVLCWNATHLSRAAVSVARGGDEWIADCRQGFGGEAVAGILAEKGLAAARIGLVGLAATSAGEREGTLPHTFYERLVRAAPRAQFADATQDYADLLLVKSAEELALVRYAAHASEAACAAMIAATRPGAGEDEIYAETMRAIFRLGCDARYPMMSLHSGSANIAWGRPRWIVRAEPARRIAPGDMVQAEIHTLYGGQEAQVQMSIALAPVSDVNRRCAEIARHSYEIGVATARPGLRFAELIAAMARPLAAAGCWAKTPLAHTMNFGAAGGTLVNRDQLAGTAEAAIERATPPGMRRPDLILEPGMLLELEPNASLGLNRVNIGGPIVITERGCEELAVLPTRVHHVG